MSVIQNLTKNGGKCRVTFKFSAAMAELYRAGNVRLTGNFCNWGSDDAKYDMGRLKDGSFSITITLDAGTECLFKYIVNGNDWVCDDDVRISKIDDGRGGQNSSITVKSAV